MTVKKEQRYFIPVEVEVVRQLPRSADASAMIDRFLGVREIRIHRLGGLQGLLTFDAIFCFTQMASKPWTQSQKYTLGLFVALVVKLCAIAWLKGLVSLPGVSYSELLGYVREYLKLTLFVGYIGEDYPATWPIPRPKVIGAFDNSFRYDLVSDEGVEEWTSLVPSDGVIYLGEDKQPFMVSMMHQLRCLNIIREQLVMPMEEKHKTEDISRHCLNYMRQMLTCRMDLQLEPFQYTSHQQPIDLTGEWECNDWEGVYREVQENQKLYAPKTRS